MHNRQAIEWQLWTTLATYLLLRYLHAACQWEHTFTRLFTALRAVLWEKRGLDGYLKQQEPLFPCFGLRSKPICRDLLPDG